MRPTFRSFIVVAILAATIAGVATRTAAQSSSAPPAAQATPTVSTDPVDLRVMTFNVWLGAVQVDFDTVVATIQATKADVVGVQEAEGTIPRIAAALGWSYYDTRLQIVSRFPLIDPPGADGIYTFVEPRPGQVVAVANVHLPSDPYGPEAVRDGATVAEVLALETETRLPAIARQLEVLPGLAASGIPVVLTGDFNAPSHLDWTEAVAASRPAVRFPVAWPVSEALETAGFHDTYREVHPDPVARPGLTWTPGYPNPTVRPEETFDRIDLVLTAGPAEAIASDLVGETGGPDVDIPMTPWPSDHRGVVSTVRVTPAPPPLLVATAARAVMVGDAFTIRYHAPGESGDHIALLRAGDPPGTTPLMSLVTGESTVDGSVVFGAGTLAPGAYAAALIGANDAELARIPFWILAPDATPTLTVASPSMAPDAAVTVAWENAPGNRWDWLAVYAADDPDLGNYLAYVYTEATIAGHLAFTTADFGAPLPPGDYEVRLFRDDGYVLLATAPFTVTDPETEGRYVWGQTVNAPRPEPRMSPD